MTGPHDSVIGVRKEQSIRRIKDLLPVQYKVAEGDLRLSGVLIEANPATGKALHIERISMLVDQVPDEVIRGEGEE